MSGRVPIRVPTGAPATAFLSRPGPAAPVPDLPARLSEPEPAPPPKPPARTEVQEAPSAPVMAATALGARAEFTPARPQQVEEPLVRFQFFLPARLAGLVDAERARRKASGYRGRGKSDYTAIFRDLVEKHLQ